MPSVSIITHFEQTANWHANPLCDVYVYSATPTIEHDKAEVNVPDLQSTVSVEAESPQKMKPSGLSEVQLSAGGSTGPHS